jgi:hypothetical protein
LIIFLRNRLKYALTKKEVLSILMQRLIKVDNKVRTDTTYPAGFMGKCKRIRPIQGKVEEKKEQEKGEGGLESQRRSFSIREVVSRSSAVVLIGGTTSPLFMDAELDKHSRGCMRMRPRSLLKTSLCASLYVNSHAFPRPFFFNFFQLFYFPWRL